MDVRTILNDKTLCLENVRLKTFTEEWPNDPNWFCTPEKLANAGFYFNPSDECLDNVCCAFCCKELDGWEPDDDPLVEHKKHSAKCPFLKLTQPLEDMTLEEIIKFIKKSELFLNVQVFTKKINQFKEEAKETREKIVSLWE